MKKYVVILLFTKDIRKILMVKRKNKPYENCWNGIGGKIEGDETEIEAAIRECKEETNITINNPKLLVTYMYPNNRINNSGTNLSVIYDFIDKVEVIENREGIYEWKDIEFAKNSEDRTIAGFANISQFIKEILDEEGIKKFYK